MAWLSRSTYAELCSLLPLPLLRFVRAIRFTCLTAAATRRNVCHMPYAICWKCWRLRAVLLVGGQLSYHLPRKRTSLVYWFYLPAAKGAHFVVAAKKRALYSHLPPLAAAADGGHFSYLLPLPRIPFRRASRSCVSASFGSVQARTGKTWRPAFRHTPRRTQHDASSYAYGYV